MGDDGPGKRCPHMCASAAATLKSRNEFPIASLVDTVEAARGGIQAGGDKVANGVSQTPASCEDANAGSPELD